MALPSLKSPQGDVVYVWHHGGNLGPTAGKHAEQIMATTKWISLDKEYIISQVMFGQALEAPHCPQPGFRAMKTTFDQDERHTMIEAKCILTQWYHRKQTMLEGRASWRPRGLTWWNIVPTPCSFSLNGYETVPNTTHLWSNQPTTVPLKTNKPTNRTIESS